MTDAIGETTGLYRFFDAAGCLLYVGISRDPFRRWKAHESDKPWWYDIAMITLTRFASRREAEVAERGAIRAERPLWNVVHAKSEAISDAEWQALKRRVDAGEWLRPGQVAILLGLSRTKVHNMLRDGQLGQPGNIVGSRYRLVNPAAVRERLAEIPPERLTQLDGDARTD